MANQQSNYSVVAAIQVLVNHLENEALCVYMTNAGTHRDIQGILAAARLEIRGLLGPGEDQKLGRLEEEGGCPDGWCPEGTECVPCGRSG